MNYESTINRQSQRPLESYNGQINALNETLNALLEYNPIKLPQ